MLDLGSGGGIDVILSARRVGPTGIAYGLDMTDEMLALAQQQRARGRRRERAFPERRDRGRSRCRRTRVDVVISNCVINLSTDKAGGADGDRARAEARRARSGSATSSPRTA